MALSHESNDVAAIDEMDIALVYSLSKGASGGEIGWRIAWTGATEDADGCEFGGVAGRWGLRHLQKSSSNPLS